MHRVEPRETAVPGGGRGAARHQSRREQQKGRARDPGEVLELGHCIPLGPSSYTGSDADVASPLGLERGTLSLTW